MSEYENPPAFPMGNPEQGGYDGMTLRDYFAGQVDVQAYDPVATFKDAKGRLPSINELAEYIAEIRMAEAGAMLFERSKTNDQN